MNVSQMRNILADLPDDATVWVVDNDGAGQYTPNQHALLGEPVESIVFRLSPNPEWDRAREAAREIAKADMRAEIRRELAAQLRAEVVAADGEGETT